METDEMDEIIDHIIRNALKFIGAEFDFSFKTKKITPLDIIVNKNMIFLKMLLNSVLTTSDMLGISPLDMYDSLKLRDKLKMIMENKDEP